jgi:hypothetical protein
MSIRSKALLPFIVLAFGCFATLAAEGISNNNQVGGAQDGIDNPSAAKASYSGPGDVVSGAIGFWSIYQCYSAAYVGNVATVYDSAGVNHTLITCTAGGVIHETLQSLATTCASGCEVGTLYDQTATLGNVTEIPTPVGSGPAVTRLCLGSLPCWGIATSQCLVTAGSASNAQPYTMLVAIDPTTTATGVPMASDSGGGFTGAIIRQDTTVDWLGYAGASVTGAAPTISSFQVVQFAASGTSSSVSKNGSVTTGSGGTQAFNSTITVGCQDISGGLGSTNGVGNYVAAGIWPSALSSANQLALSANVRSYWGF